MLTRDPHEFGEQPLGERITGHALGMPLNAHDPVGVAVPLDTFDSAVGGLRGHPQVLAGPIDSLVVAAVDRASVRPIQSLQAAAWCKGSRMLDIAFDGSGWQVRASMR